MNRYKIAGLAGFLALGAAFVFIGLPGGKIPDGCNEIELECDFKVLDGDAVEAKFGKGSNSKGYMRASFPAIECSADAGFPERLLTEDVKGGGGKDAMMIADVSTCKRVECAAKGECKKAEKKSFACAYRPAGVDAGSCFRRVPLPDGGTKNVDPGELNAIPEGQWVGVGCAERPCVEVAGKPFK